LNWDFSDGLYPDGWGWGEWQIENGILTGDDPDGNCAVYFLPFTHSGNVILETKTRLRRNTVDHHVEAQLLTRDDRAVHSESGMAIIAEENRVDVRHMVETVRYIREILPSENRFFCDQWYVMRFIFQDGKIDAYVDGEHVFSSEHHALRDDVLDSTAGVYPVAVYHEPHLAVRYGMAQFEYVKIFADQNILPVAASENYPYGPVPLSRANRHWLVTVMIWIFCTVIFIVCIYVLRHYAFTLNRLFGRQRQPYWGTNFMFIRAC